MNKFMFYVKILVLIAVPVTVNFLWNGAGWVFDLFAAAWSIIGGAVLIMDGKDC